MQKRVLTAFTAGALALTLTACGGSSESPSVSSTATPSVTQTAPVETAPAISFAETVLVDNEQCTFKITAVEEDSLWGYTLKAYLENKTDKELMFSLQNVSVNGFMCDPFWAVSVTPSMKANEQIRFNSSDFERNGIAEVTAIEGTLRIYDSNDWTAGDVFNHAFAIYPLGQEAVQPYTRVPVEGETVLFENDSCAMIVTGFDPDNSWGYTVNVYLENKTDQDLMFSIQDASVNGFMCDPFWAETVAAGKRSNTTISWMASDFEENGITQVETLTLPIRVYDSNDWLTEDLVMETFTVTP